jgi:bacillolysin
MKARASQVSLISLMCLVLLVASTPVLASAPPPPQFAAQAALSYLQQAAGGTLKVEWTGIPGSPPRFVSGRIPSDETDPEQVARQFFARYGALYAMRDQARELALARVERDELGMQHVRFAQTVSGVPVFGAQMVVHMRDDQITAVNGQYIPRISVDVVDAIPDLSIDEALAITRGDLNDEDAEFRATRSELTIYARRNHPPTLAWKVNVFSHNPLGNWLYFIDAHTGTIVHRLNQLDTAKVLRTYDANNGTNLPGTLTCTNSDGTCPSGDTDERAAHQNASITYDYFSTFGRDSYDDSGATIKSSVHYSFFYNNAFWNGSQMVYGDGDGTTFIGLARELDVVAHELTHAVTENEANLIYEDQSGALN